jgi:fido (protein-threonine AMPylation protein)
MSLPSLTDRQRAILTIVQAEEPVAVSHVRGRMEEKISLPTLNREMAQLVRQRCLERVGKGRNTVYRISLYYRLCAPPAVAEADYFEADPDRRGAATRFNPALLDGLADISMLTEEEASQLEQWRQAYRRNLASFSPVLYRKELERLTIELSWKSAQIEGNTYSLLETEQLFLEHRQAQGKSKHDAIMLLNHKEALNYLLEHPGIGDSLSIALLEDVHTLLVKDLGVGRNIRARTVGITGSAYTPLDNCHQIRENLERTCTIINAKKNGFEKALLAVLLISYIQPFEDGNKRTGRMIGNALLLAHGACPLSYRSVDPLDYKKAMLLFYEQHNAYAFKRIFIEQNRFSVEHYFR